MAQKGFTLIELMVVIVVLSVVVSLAAPSFSAILQDNRAASMGEDLQGALQYARSEAVKRRQNVQVCRRNAAGSNCENGTDWSSGWLVKLAAGSVLKVWDSAQGLAVVGPSIGVTFRGNGLAAASNFSVQPTGCTGQQRREVAVSATGTSTSSKAACQ